MRTQQLDSMSARSGSIRSLAVASATALLITLWVYWPCLDYGFLAWDDYENIVNNANYRGLGPSHLWWMFNTLHMGPYQPLSWVSFGVDYCIWGMDPRGYHLTNVVVHAVNAALVVWVTGAVFHAWRRRVGRAEPSSRAEDTAPSRHWAVAVGGLAAGLIWAVHPQRVESVAWVTERRDVMCGLFYLLCVWCYLRGHDTDRAERARTRWQWAAIVCGLLAVLSKGTAVSLPVVLLALDVYLLGRLTGPVASWWRRPQRSVVLEKANYALFSLLGIGVGFIGQWLGGGIRTLDQVGLVDRLALVAHAIVFYLAKLVAPVGLSPMYARPVPLDWISWRFLGSGLVVAAITALVVLLRRRWPVALVAWSCYVAMLLPVSGLVTIGHELVADRYSYLPTLAMAVTLGGLMTWAWHRLRWGVARAGLGLAAAAAVAGLVVGARTLIPIWRDDIALWEHAVAVNPDTPRAQTNLGGVYSIAGRHEDALVPLSWAIELDATSYKPRLSLGIALRALGRYEQAADAFAGAIDLKPNDVKARKLHAEALMYLGRIQEAVDELKRALDLAPSDKSLRAYLMDIEARQPQGPP